jgi:hypothetical protein
MLCLTCAKKQNILLCKSIGGKAFFTLLKQWNGKAVQKKLFCKQKPLLKIIVSFRKRFLFTLRSNGTAKPFKRKVSVVSFVKFSFSKKRSF